MDAPTPFGNAVPANPGDTQVNPPVLSAPITPAQPTNPSGPIITDPSLTPKKDAQGNIAYIGNSGLNTPSDTATNGIQTARQNNGSYVGQDGKQYYNYDGTPVNSPTISSGTQNGTTNTDSNAPTLPDQADRSALAQAQADYQATAKQVSDTITNIQNGSVPLTASEQAQLDGLKLQFQGLIDQQNQVNSSSTGLANVRGYQTGVGEYDSAFQARTIGAIVTAGQSKIADINVKMASAVASLTQSFKDNDIKAVKDAWSVYQDASKQRTDALQKTVDDTAKAIKDAQDAKVAADKVYQDTVQNPINDLAKIAKNNGASNEVIASIMASKSLGDAYNAAGNYAAQGTGMVAEYNYAKANGYTGSFSQYQTEDANRKAAAASPALLPGTTTEVPAGLGSASSGGSILNATGLSVAAFNFLTQGTASMSRMTAAQRTQIMNEAQSYLNRTGTDISTFQSQYKAYNDVLQKNISRANQTQIMAGEVAGSADALMSAIDEKDMGNIKASNIISLLAGEQVNDPTVQKYNFQLKAMANDLAGYFAASRGASTPELQDQRDAADVIASGMSKRSAQAFKDSVLANEAKVSKVVNNAVDSTRKQVWGLFGVGDKFKPGAGNSTMDNVVQTQQEAKAKVDDYIRSNPDKAESVAKLYETPSAAFGGALPTDDQIAEYLNL